MLRKRELEGIAGTGLTKLKVASFSCKETKFLLCYYVL